MHYGRSGSVGDASSAIAGGYDSEYADSPPDASVAHRQAAAAAAYHHHPNAYAHTPPALETTYANGPVFHSGPAGSYYPHSSYNPATGTTAGTHEAAAYAPSAGGYGYYEEEKPNTRDYSSPNAARAYAAGTGQPTWTPAYSGYTSSASSRPPRHSDSPPLSPIDTRTASYFPTTGRDYPLSAVTSSSAANGNVPSSPTTPSSLSDSPSTPFSPHYASPYAHGHGHGHSHSHSASSTASASAYIQGTPLPPLQLNNPSAGGHFVPPTGSEYAVPAIAGPYSTTQGYGRSSPPEQTRLPPPAPQVQPSGHPAQPNPFAGPGFAARPFLCDDCGMNFARTHDLKRHQTTHVAGVKKTHPCPYCGKNLSRRDAIKRHVVSKQCPVAADKPHLSWPPPVDHVPPPPDTVIERTTHRRGENPYPVLSSSSTSTSDRSQSAGYSSSPYSSTSPTSPGANGGGHFSPNGYSPYAGAPGAHTLPPPVGYESGGAVVFEYDPRSSGYKGR